MPFSKEEVVAIPPPERRVRGMTKIRLAESTGTEPPPSMTDPVGFYVAVHEYQGSPPPGCTRSVMRPCSIVLEAGPKSNVFVSHEVSEDPSTRALTYRCVRKPNPSWTDRSLLAMDFIAWIPGAQALRIGSMFAPPDNPATRGWSSRFFVREALRRMVEAKIVTVFQYRIAVSRQQEAVSADGLSTEPNFLPDILDPREDLREVETAAEDGEDDGRGSGWWL